VSGGPSRRALLTAATAWPLAACTRGEPPAFPPGGWVGADHARGHRLREPLPPGTTGAPRRATVLVLGGGIAGLAAARGFVRAGVDDVQLLELEDQPGGNARGHAMAGMACPLGAHYLPQPQAPAHEVVDWLHEIGLLRQEAGRTVADERHLCHAPQERLWFEGAWHEGLLPPADPGSATLAQYRRFAAAVAKAPAFAIPAHRAPWTAAHEVLDSQTMAAWLDAQGLDDTQLRWYLDYACRDDYGAGLDVVSAWAGLHYFASRHGFAAPGDGDEAAEPVFTWPEGNAWLVQRLAAPLAGRIHGGRVVLQRARSRHAVQVTCGAGSGFETWTAGTVVLALPLFVATARADSSRPRPCARPPPPPCMRPGWWPTCRSTSRRSTARGCPAAWDSVPYGWAAHWAMSTPCTRACARMPVPLCSRPTPRCRSPIARRCWTSPGRHWAGAGARRTDSRCIPTCRERVQRIDLMRYGHAMAVPVPGRARSAAARAALRGGSGRVRFAHADLAGYSVFEEAFIAGCEAARPMPLRLIPILLALAWGLNWPAVKIALSSGRRSRCAPWAWAWARCCCWRWRCCALQPLAAARRPGRASAGRAAVGGGVQHLHRLRAAQHQHLARGGADLHDADDVGAAGLVVAGRAARRAHGPWRWPGHGRGGAAGLAGAAGAGGSPGGAPPPLRGLLLPLLAAWAGPRARCCSSAGRCRATASPSPPGNC
jgi:hypothetical protein